MEIQYLEWDSCFFEKKTGKIDFQEVSNANEVLRGILDDAKKQKYNLIYLFSKGDSYIDDDILKTNGGKLVDRKIVFTGTIDNVGSDLETIEEYSYNFVNNRMVELAYISGEFSRYKVDSEFSELLF